ncbi:hypothetical protein [Clostridium scatologenes]|uniref:Uncharacterized protein n=1 Tax=Clostridium scatologenes TaxID=1548 RepID=A0A0E3GRD5_CLOSL|nr:hypothetical protein [Clostridium scatologenes]AKA70131.1 hypothetical protein CSCA_3006 [Clostridium scatologenes]
MSTIAIAKQFNKRPSEIIGLDNLYEAFCFDEACLYIINEISKENSKTPKWNNENTNRTNNKDLINELLKAKK